MTAPLSRDLRERIVQAVEGGSSARAAAERFEISASAAIKLMQRVRRTGSTAPAKMGGHGRPVLEPHADAIRVLALSLHDRKAEHLSQDRWEKKLPHEPHALVVVNQLPSRSPAIPPSGNL